ncbi:N-acetyl-D-Glu racemase DgcA [Fulvimarina sp. 2208YS6-2-32]|uniref:Dipeptide epimerase n=1 Tax=Fulvimarina uroteuthidis TaxID=3098149 RepID=A0ABU5I2H2_9HYPH|nr:N-acetyl-D-Glu racemase DgcA [Fulvimarina sp. 2208YS6-2-32]MDY8109535.1 N-acetyl-D-Glu racemase DgcA [Fulvimarina sp. 2208YS6-2-32]
MTSRLSVTVERFPLAAEFRIARGSKTEATVIVATLERDGFRGRGECVPYGRYGESVESVHETIHAIADDLANGLDRQQLQERLPAGAARNAVDCAFWDLEAKMTGRPVSSLVCRQFPRPIETAYTISLDQPGNMGAAARAADRNILKIKMGTPNDIERIRAVHAAARGARLILDANEGWDETCLRPHMLEAARGGAVLIEQPLPVGADDILATMPHPVPLCADESAHTTADLEGLMGRYDFVNIKLDKTGGLTEALKMMDKARELGFGVMVGCMVSSSLAMAPASLLAQEADIVDLDGPLLIAKDREHAMHYTHSMMSPPDPALWG